MADQVIFGGDDEAEENGDYMDDENYVGMDEMDDEPTPQVEESEGYDVNDDMDLEDEDDNMTEDNQDDDTSTNDEKSETQESGQQTMNGKPVEENVDERATTKVLTLDACSSANMSIKRAETDDWINFDSKMSKVDKDEMKERLEDLQADKDLWNGPIKLKMINRGDMDSPDIKFVDFEIPDDEDIPDDYEPVDNSDSSGSSGSSSSRSKSSSSSSSKNTESTGMSVPKFRAVLKVKKDDEDLEYTGHATAEDPQSDGQLLELAETRAIKRAIKFTPALYKDDFNGDPVEADKAACLQALNRWADSYQIQSTQIVDGEQ